jgi:hypothetical protein
MGISWVPMGPRGFTLFPKTTSFLLECCLQQGLPTKAHTYTMFHILLHPTQNTRTHKRSWNAEDVKKNAASLSYSQMDYSQCIASVPQGSACQCLQPWLLLGFSHSIASRTLPSLGQIVHVLVCLFL